VCRQSQSRWRQQDNAEVTGGVVVDVEREPDLLGVKGRRLADVCDRQGDDLDRVVHQAPTMAL
jgi:hypothetical protein